MTPCGTPMLQSGLFGFDVELLVEVNARGWTVRRDGGNTALMIQRKAL